MKEWWEWTLAGMAALVLFLLSLGIKDVRDRLYKVDEHSERLAKLEEAIRRLNGQG